ncbi:MAG: hypothetical protein NTY19_05400, partial [Planctomycetota bacterium]|nr:hypothetical protein [Planctomycetota bacterium]
MSFGHFRVPTTVLGTIASWLLVTGVLAAESPVAGGLRLDSLEGSKPGLGRLIPVEAIQVFVHEDAPRSVRVTAQQIAVDYGRSGVFFDRSTGGVAKRFTVADGWPNVRPDGFAKPARRALDAHLVGPGVLNPWFTPPVTSTGFPGAAIGPDLDQAPRSATVVEVKFDGAVWRAIQPAGFLRKVERARPGGAVAWSDILKKLNDSCYVEVLESGQPPKRFTAADGLASNIVTHLVVHEGSRWAACVDIDDRQSKTWEKGGLCR